MQKANIIKFLLPTKGKMIIFLTPLLIIVLFAFFRNGFNIMPGFFVLWGLGFIFCALLESAMWDCGFVKWFMGSIIIYLLWYIISCFILYALKIIKRAAF